jgi:two-component system, OmpR family, phosphate regulon sensor histidine kinase PhoR
MKGDFVTTVSHELRTPLAAIYGSAETLRRGDIDLTAETRDRLTANISREAERLGRIVGEILLTSDLDTGRFHLATKEVDPAALVRDVIESMQPMLDEKGMQAQVTVPASVPSTAADADKLRQVLLNLLDNAIKYSPEGGTIETSLELGEGCLRFAVRDQGPGIPADERERVFAKFYRLDPQLTGGVGGTGLGLYICKEIVRRMGGRIWVASPPEGGATVFVEVPHSRLAERRNGDGGPERV